VTSTPLLLARQPILDERQRLFGYEILYRPVRGAMKRASDCPDVATATVSVHAVLDIGIEKLAGDAQVFVNVTRHTLEQGLYEFLPPERVVLEVPEDCSVDESLVKWIERAKDKGFRIALDDFVMSGPTAPLVPLADVIKIEVPALDEEGLRRHAEALARPGVRLLAEKVETRAIQRCCLDAGYDLFQGYFFSEPEHVAGSHVAPDRTLLMRLLAEVHDPEATIESLEQLVVVNNALAYKLLKYVNSALHGVAQPIESIRHAIVMLGLDRVRTCASMLLLSGLDSKPQELVLTALMRARSCELIGRARGRENPQKLFTVGLLSLLDSFLDRPMPDLLADLPIADDIRAALIDHRGPLAGSLEAAIAFEGRDGGRELDDRVDPEQWNECYVEALSWTQGMSELLAD
jgi:EAL and modified HD-GYP domain-containing signal transduction protein